jgi:hypothetical protein
MGEGLRISYFDGRERLLKQYVALKGFFVEETDSLLQ